MKNYRKLLKRIKNNYEDFQKDSDSNISVAQTHFDIIEIDNMVAKSLLSANAFTLFGDKYTQNKKYPFTKLCLDNIEQNFYFRIRNSNIGIIIRDIFLILSFILSIILTVKKYIY